MRAAVNAFALWSAAAALQIVLLCGSAAAQEVAQGSPEESESAPAAPTTEDAAEPADTTEVDPEPAGSGTRGSGQWGADRWVPSIAATSGITIQEWKGKVASQKCNACTLPNASAVELQPSTSGDDRDVTPFVGGIFELMTPELPIPLSPRIFADGAFYGSFGFDRDVASEGQPGTLRSPLPPPVNGMPQVVPYTEDAVLGQGSETNAQLQPFIYGADAGIAFPFEFYGRAFRLKPSIGWIRFTVEVKGAVSDAECREYIASGQTRTNCNVDTIPNPPVPTGVQRDIVMHGNSTDTYDGIGGGLDLEMDAIRIGPLGSSLFIGAHAYKVLGNREQEMTASLAFPAFVPPTPGLGAIDTAAQWSYEVDEFVYRVGLGFKVQWIGDTD